MRNWSRVLYGLGGFSLRSSIGAIPQIVLGAFRDSEELTAVIWWNELRALCSAK